ncbi:MAG: hypothetical protein SNJ75_18450 [Gemmataceae bacterium]
MGLFYRVFGRGDTVPSAELLCQQLGDAVQVSVDADETGWYRLEMVLGLGGALTLERYTPEDDGFRAELNTWAAYLETCDYSPHHTALMERVIQTRQLFILRKPIDCPDEARADRLCGELCVWLAAQCDGIFHHDEVGFYDAAGTLLVAEY